MAVTSPSPALIREKAIRATVVASVSAKAFSIACTLAQVPLALRYLGTEAYGLWITLVSIVSLLNFVDFGLGVGMQHAMARAYGSDDGPALRRTFWTGTAALTILGAATLLLGAAVVHAGSWAALLKIHDPQLRQEAEPALLLALASFVVALPFNAAARLAAAVQRGWIHAAWIAVGSAASLGVVALASAGRWGFLAFLGGSLLVPAAQGFGLFLHLFRFLGWGLRPVLSGASPEIRGLLRSSLYVSLPQFGLALIQSAPAIAIAMAAGSSAVTGYNLLMRLFNPIQQAQVLLLTPVWPAYTEAHVRRDHAWIGRAFRGTLVGLAATVTALVVVAWQSPALLHLWIGRDAVLVGAGVTFLTALWCILQMALQPFIYYLMGSGQMRRLAYSATPGLILSAAALFAGARSGSVGVILAAGAASLGIVLLPAIAWQTLASLRTFGSG